jgi:hypothetical protein
VFHAGGSSLDSVHVKGYQEFIETHTLGFLWANMARLTSVIVQGVPEKFPELAIVFQECGLFRIPLMMYRLDAEYLKRQSKAPLLDRRPSDYIREFYYGTQPLENPDESVFLNQVIEMFGGPERLMYATDYPHWDYDEPSSITDLPFLTDEEKQRILGAPLRKCSGYEPPRVQRGRPPTGGADNHDRRGDFDRRLQYRGGVLRPAEHLPASVRPRV